MAGQTAASGGTVEFQPTNSGSAAVLAEDEDVFADATGGVILLALPALAGVLGLTFTFVKTDATANTVTLDGSGGETINGALTYVLAGQGASVTIVARAARWDKGAGGVV